MADNCDEKKSLLNGGRKDRFAYVRTWEVSRPQIITLYISPNLVEKILYNDFQATKTLKIMYSLVSALREVGV